MKASERRGRGAIARSTRALRPVEAPSASFYREVFRQSPRAIVVTDEETRIREANRAAAELLGTGVGQLVGRRLVDLAIAPDDERLRLALSRFDGDGAGPSELCEVQLEPHQGVRRGVLLRAAAMRADDGRFRGIQWFLEDVTARTAAEQEPQREHALLDAINRMQSGFIADVDPKVLFEEMLTNLLALTRSEYGFIGEILHDADGAPYLKAHSITNIAWDDRSRELYEKQAAQGMEFHNLKTLFGAVITGGEPVISNDPPSDPRRGGLPGGHPALRSFLGLPIFRGAALVGMAGVANRPGGYDDSVIDHVRPYVVMLGNIIEAYRTDQRRREAEDRLWSANAALRSSEAGFRALSECSPVGIFVADPDGNCTYANPRCQEILGATFEQCLGRGWTRFVHPDDLDVVVAESRRAVLEKRGYSSEVRYASPRAGERWTHVRTAPLRSPTGEPLGYVGTVEDISERKRIEHSLRAAVERFNLVVEGSADGIWDGQVVPGESWTSRKNHLYFSPRFKSLLGYDEDEFNDLLEQYAAIHPDDSVRVFQTLADHLAGRGPFDLEYRLRTKSGEYRWFHVRGQAVVDDRGRPVRMAGSMRDVTDRKQAEQALRSLSGTLLRLQDEERRRIARELHDVTAPNLVGLLMNLARLKRIRVSGRGRREVLAECLALAEQSLREIRTLSYVLHPPLLDELGLAAALRCYVDGFVERSGIRVTLEIPPGFGRMPAEIETLLFRAVQEGLTNVHRHSGSTTAAIRLDRDDREVRLEIVDRGQGLVTAPSNSAAHGVGIAGMRERVAQLGGRLEIHPADPGAAVQVVLPLEEGAA